MGARGFERGLSNKHARTTGGGCGRARPPRAVHLLDRQRHWRMLLPHQPHAKAQLASQRRERWLELPRRGFSLGDYATTAAVLGRGIGGGGLLTATIRDALRQDAGRCSTGEANANVGGAGMDDDDLRAFGWIRTRHEHVILVLDAGRRPPVSVICLCAL